MSDNPAPRQPQTFGTYIHTSFLNEHRNLTLQQVNGAYHPLLEYDILDRLCWSVLDDVSDVQVADDPNDPLSTRQPLAGHPVAMESLINVNFNITLLQVSVDILADRDGERLGLVDEYDTPVLSIELQEGQPLTIGEFVRKVHVFVQEYQNDLIEAFTEIEGEPVAGTRYIFRACDAPEVYLEEGRAEVVLDFIRYDPGEQRYHFYEM